MSTHIWHVDVAFTEEGERTRADALVSIPGQRFHGFGLARRAPADPNVPLIGEELAAARALSDVSHKLLQAVAARVKAYEGHTVAIHR